MKRLNNMMKKINWLIWIALCAILMPSCASNSDITSQIQEKKNFTPDTLSVIRNPGMGWTIYDDASGPVANAQEFWQLQDTLARKYASTLYIRWRWSDMEPEEGKYAWDHDPNFKALVQGAKDRGLRLAFRVYMASQDNQYESTPKYVFDAGAKYYMEKGVPGEVRSPYPDDPIFQNKFETFIHAFAKEFDKPELVNYVDGYNIGWWGEGHNLQFLDWNNKEKTFEWIVNLYGNSFRNVPLVITIDSQIGHDLELKHAINKQGYAVRRDGYASYWMPESQKKLLQGLFPKCFVVAECCYWQDRTIESVNKIDKKYNWDSWADYYHQVVNEALETHANYLDLREPVEALRWTGEASAETKKFARKGGYRIYPKQVSYSIKNGLLKVNHTWLNLGVGVLPNNCKAWANKYKVAIALRNSDNKIVKQWISEKADPSQWIHQRSFTYEDEFETNELVSGKYQLLIGIYNTLNEKMEITLATDKPNVWADIDSVIIDE